MRKNMKPSQTVNQNKTNISLRYRGLSPRALWQHMIETQISQLQHLASIACATITMERQYQAKPAFRVLATLEVPGPDYHAEASDYTLHAALLKVLNNLRRQIQSRNNRRLDRHKSNSHSGLPSSRSNNK
jgi:ribosome-associated translation inhibitor RaiA